MWPDWLSNPGHLALEQDAVTTALHDPAFVNLSLKYDALSLLFIMGPVNCGRFGGSFHLLFQTAPSPQICFITVFR